MDAIFQAQEQLEQRSNLSKTILDLQETIQLLQNARDAITVDPQSAPLAMARLRTPVEKSFVKLDDDLKEVNKGLNVYQKALDKSFKKSTIPTAATDALSEQPRLIDRAIVMHLLREGKFEVANNLVQSISEAEAKKRARLSNGAHEAMSNGQSEAEDWLKELGGFGDQNGYYDMAHTEGQRGWLQQKFTEMYNVLDALRNQHDLGPAIRWAREHSSELEQRGSNLEFELSRLKFVELYYGTEDSMQDDDEWMGPLRALEYAQATFQTLSARYVHETSNLVGSLAYSSDLQSSPYNFLFGNQSSWEDVCNSFTREFCGLLGLSEKSPLYTAVTAGGIALPVLEKVERIMAQTRGQWTSVNELPVETPLPYSFKFHSVFVCPVSKEQGTDENPPMMLPCGHVLAKESLEAHGRGKARMKCPYCPSEFAGKDAKRIFI